MLSLPQVVTFSNGNTITYLYTADGRKLRTVHVTNGTATTTDYCGNVIYENGTARLLLTEAGYVDLTDNSHHFYIKDHLGNNRVVADANGTVEESNQYYPFGLNYANAGSNLQPYKYNGKELDTKNGLNWYDYGARHYDAALGRWHVVDPLSEKMYGWSPYGYCLNNPVKLIDTDGAIPTLYEAALIAKHVYGDKVQLAGGWKISNIAYPSMNSESGLQSAVYERTVNNVTEYVYATAGTQLTDFEDIKEDITQLWGQTNQYNEAVEISNKLSDELGNSELTFVGHSLGGGLATANALATDKNAITFNPAALSPATKRNLGLTNMNKGKITNVVVEGEIVDYLQSVVGLSLEGDKQEINANYLDYISILNTIRRIKNHSIDTIIDKMNKK